MSSKLVMRKACLTSRPMSSELSSVADLIVDAVIAPAFAGPWLCRDGGGPPGLWGRPGGWAWLARRSSTPT